MSVLAVTRRTGYLVLIVLVAHVILISAQVSTRSGSRVLEVVTFGVMSEVLRAGASTIEGARQFWAGYLALRHLEEENRALRDRITALEVSLQEQRALANRGQRLGRLLAFREHLAPRTLAASVIAGDASGYFHTVSIDRGSADGVRPDMAVVAAQGAVGRVIGQPASRAARVQLIIDRVAAAGALIERSRTGGVVVGDGGDPPLRMEYVSNLADVVAGDVVVTSGIDGIYPKGFVIGRVESVSRGPGLYKTIGVRPSVDFSALEEVLVVLDRPASEETAGEGPS